MSSQPVWRAHPAFRAIAGAAVVFGLPILLLVGLVGLVADDATWFERLLLVVVNPVTIVVGARAVFDEQFWARQRARNWIPVLCVVAIVLNVIAAVLIASGAGEGDVELPIIFAVPLAVIGLVLAMDTLLAVSTSTNSVLRRLEARPADSPDRFA